MVKKWIAKIKSAAPVVRDFLEEKGVGTASWDRSRFYRFGHFCVLVGKSFARNRCPVRAAALAYTTSLALIPMLAVALSVSTSLLKKEGEERILHFIDSFVANVTPPAPVGTNMPGRRIFGGTNALATPPSGATNALNAPEEARGNPLAGETNTAAVGPAAVPAGGMDMRKQAARRISEIVQRTSSSALGLTGTVFLIFAAINMLSQVESTLNDIWGVARGRSWAARILQYSAVLVWGPVLLVCALGLASGPHFQTTKQMISSMPYVGSVFFQVLPVALLCLAFGLLYMLMPNTKVQWQAALVGGVVGGLLWHLNNVFSVFYVSRWVTNSKFYGWLAMIPVFMVGLYFGWLILLFGAQVAYAFQNRKAYVQEKQAEHVNQRGREFIALRLMTFIGERFQHGRLPPSIPELAGELGVPTRLVQQILQILAGSRLLVEASGPDNGYAPARPLEAITCHDILLAMRAGHGQELATCDGPGRTEVYGEFQQILEAERKTASAVTVLMMVDRTEALAAAAARDARAVADSPDSQN